MPRAAGPTPQKKRKRDSAPSKSVPVSPPKPPAPSTLEIDQSGSEDDAPSGSASRLDDEESDEEPFPEINAEDDSDVATSENEDGKGSEGSSEGSYLIEDSDFVDSVDSGEEGPEDELPIKTGPKGKTVISQITGRPKRVYPEIEPDYDSDSSTEDVWFTLYTRHIYSSTFLGPKSHRECANALV